MHKKIGKLTATFKGGVFHSGRPNTSKDIRFSDTPTEVLYRTLKFKKDVEYRI